LYYIAAEGEAETRNGTDQSSQRFGVGRFNTSDEITRAAELIANSVDRARQAAATSNRSLGMVREADHDAVYQ
jgi:hypothetical protein